MRIKDTLERIPGGMMVVPLLLGAVINTFAPGLLRIGNFTEALFVNSAGALIALFLLCAGAQINLRSVGPAAAKGVTLLAVKWVAGAAVGLAAYAFAGVDGLFLGMVPLAIIAAMTNSNGGLYVAIVGQYGRADDRAAYSILALNDGPFLTMIADKLSLCFSALALKSSKSMLPSSSDLTMTHLRPAITAEAGFVPWAETGIKHTLRWPSPIDCW